MAVAVLSNNNLNFTTDGSTPLVQMSAGGSTGGSATLTMSEGANQVELIGLRDPTVANAAATKSYVDAISVGISWKEPVRAVATVNGALATAYVNGATVDGVTLATNDRILLAGQTNQVENGLYIVQASGAPNRSTDLTAAANASGLAVFVEEGTTYADSAWVCTSDAGSDVVGTNNLVFVQFSGLGQVVAGDGLVKTGNTHDVDATGIRTTGAQSISGVKTFSASPIMSANISLTGTTSGNGYIEFADTVAPGVTTNRLYVVGGALTFDGTSVNPVNTGVAQALAYYDTTSTLNDAAITITTTTATNDSLSLNRVTTSNGMINSAGEVLVSGGNLQLNDAIPLELGSDADASVVHSGSAFSLTNGTGATLIRSTVAAANVDVQLGADVGTANFRVLNNSGTSRLGVDGAGIVTMPAGVASSSSTTGTLVVTGGVGISGDTRCAGVSYATSHNSTSDQRLKKNIKDITDEDVAKLGLIESKEYNWKEGTQAKQWGVIAQQVEEHLPELVDTDDDSFKSVNLMSLVGLMLAKLNRLQKQVDSMA